MSVSRRNFLGGALASITLIFGGFGWREEDWYFERETGKTKTELIIEQLRAAKRVMEEQAGVQVKLRVTEQQHEVLQTEITEMRAYRMQPDAKVKILQSLPILPECEVIKWQRLT